MVDTRLRAAGVLRRGAGADPDSADDSIINNAWQAAVHRHGLVFASRSRLSGRPPRRTISPCGTCPIDGEMGTRLEIMKPDGNYAVTGPNSADQIGRAGFNRRMAILAGAEAPKISALPSPIITVDNAVKFYNTDSKV